LERIAIKQGEVSIMFNLSVPWWAIVVRGVTVPPFCWRLCV